MKRKTGNMLKALWVIVVLMQYLTAGAQQPQVAERKQLTEHQVGKDGASTIFSFYNTCPESPDGRIIAYVRCIKEPNGQEGHAPAELWVCDRDLKVHHKVADITGSVAHNGVEAQWVDNDRIAILDNDVVRIISIKSGKDLLQKKLKAHGLGHNPWQNKVLYTVYPDDEQEDYGIYELDCNTQVTRLLLNVKDCAKVPLPAFLQAAEITPVAKWRALHAQYSPDGKKISFRLDVGPNERNQLLGILTIQTGAIHFKIKALHFLWYDNQSYIGHFQLDDEGKRPEAQEKRYSLTRWNLEGKVVEEMMAPRGNHLAMSPDKQYFVSETFYQTNPVIIKLYRKGDAGKAITIASFDPYKITWERRFHTNQAFSRDGKRIYYSRPLNEQHNGTFYSEIR